jgi:hypothetical protein
MIASTMRSALSRFIPFVFAAAIGFSGFVKTMLFRSPWSS